MILTFLGTGTSQGVPVIGCNCRVCLSSDTKDKRLRTSAHLQIGERSIVIDTGPDFRQQMLTHRIPRLDAVIFTHQHKDHVAGMDDVRSFYFRQKKEIPVYANSATILQLKAEFPYVFSPGDYQGVPKLKIVEISKEEFYMEDIPVVPIEVWHQNISVLGFRFGDLTYITDANFIPEPELDKIYGTKILVINALRKESHVSHFNLGEALAEIKKINPERAYITHISHRMGLHEEVSIELPPNVYLAYDGLRIST